MIDLEVKMLHDKKFVACHDNNRNRRLAHKRAVRRAWKVALARFASA